MNQKVFSFKKVDPLIGELILVANDASLVACVFTEQFERTCYYLPSFEEMKDTPANVAVMERAAVCLDKYFSGDTKAIAGVSLRIEGTPFQRAVWEALLKIPAGQSASYADIAMAVGSEGGARAVGNACNVNPLCIFVPCHRVIASDGTIGGYAGGVEVKEALLAIEKKSAESKYQRAA